jgi:hypothetical protein
VGGLDMNLVGRLEKGLLAPIAVETAEPLKF